MKRLKLEWVEKHRGDINAAKAEPILDLVHGFPGTGKSAVIAWMRKLMEDGLGWVHGVQFVCLAFQNAMAAQINGHTIHHWTGLPGRTDDAVAYGDKHKMSQKCGALRVIIIDEANGKHRESPKSMTLQGRPPRIELLITFACFSVDPCHDSCKKQVPAWNSMQIISGVDVPIMS